MLANRQEQDKEFLRLNHIDSSDVTWMEWRQDEMDALRAKVNALTAECYERAEQYGNLMNTKNIWRMAALAALGLAAMVMFMPRPHV